MADSAHISRSDIRETFIRSSGSGGQNVNKVSTGVHLTHLPTGIQVKCIKYRSQDKNRVLARALLVEKIESANAARLLIQRERAEKLRRQKRGRSKRMREEILKDKKIRSGVKSRRRECFHEEQY